MRLFVPICLSLALTAGSVQAQDRMEPEWVDRTDLAGPLYPNQAEPGTTRCYADLTQDDGMRHVAHQFYRDAPYRFSEKREEDDAPDIVRYQADDSCGLRFSNLNGAWTIKAANLATQLGFHLDADGKPMEFGQENQQLLVSHDPETGDFSVRWLYIPPGVEPRKSFGVGIGDLLLEGRIARDDIWLDAIVNFSLADRARCPAATGYRLPVQYISLRYDLVGGTDARPLLKLNWPMMDVAENCSFSIRKSRTPLDYNWVNLLLPERAP